MIIPIRCMNCGKLLADKWLFYQEELQKRRGSAAAAVQKRTYFDGTAIPETLEKAVVQEIGLNRYCCRKVFLTHVDLVAKI